MSGQNPHGGLKWRDMTTDPSCDELRIEVAWGAWPYRIVAYSDSVLVERFVPESPRRQVSIHRGDRPFEAMLSEARSVAEGWDAQMQAGAARMGLVALR
jgi:hypothetical protein